MILVLLTVKRPRLITVSAIKDLSMVGITIGLTVRTMQN